MARMSYNAKIPRRYFGEISQLTNWILDSGANFHMTPEILYYILGLLAEMDKFIEVADGNFVTEKQTGEVQIIMCDNNGKHFIATLYNVLFYQTCVIDYFSSVR